ncbi:hypothetical protein DQ04_04221040 [Trypanosoma grayi]|uniref:hypothetical protein n=1 Tax=Trypanosoma grayi TaxID=71804 RepID=UPI0004F44CD2|nr:hypothetical protein DQ04_04221040 [Trypanosoma grayi]KEG10072.1 hypothetical protein DQ04_04221040 [Trypanosoma grayi]
MTLSPLTPVDSKLNHWRHEHAKEQKQGLDDDDAEEKQQHQRQCQRSPLSPESSVKRRRFAEDLCKTEKASLLPTFYLGDHDVFEVSAKLENDFMGAALPGEWSSNICYAPCDMPDRLADASATAMIMTRSSKLLRVSDMGEVTQVFKEPAPLVLPVSASPDQCAEQPNTQKDPKTPCTPVENIIPCSSAQTPRWTPVPQTPQKSARRPPTRLMTPSTHRRMSSVCEMSVESREAPLDTALPTSHRDHLPPNKNPYSPYHSYAEEWCATLPLEMEEATLVHAGENLRRRGITSPMSATKSEPRVPQRPDLCVVMYSQTVQAPEVSSPRLCISPFSLGGQRVNDTPGTFHTEMCHGAEVNSTIAVEPECSLLETALSEVDGDGGSPPRILINPCDVSVDADVASCSRYTDAILQPLREEEMRNEAAPLSASRTILSWEVSPLPLRSTRSFHDSHRRTDEYALPHLASSITSSVPMWGSSVGLTTKRNPTGGQIAPCHTVVPTTVTEGENMHTSHSANCVKPLPDRTCSSSPSPVFIWANSDYPTCFAEDDTEAEGEGENSDEEECEPGDRFRSHHRYQFQHWLPWKNTHGFLPIHLDRNGIVWLATHRTDGLPYAVKEVPQTQKASLQTELQCLTLGNAPMSALQQQAAEHITRYYTVSPYCIVSSDSRDDVAFLLQTEYFPGGNVMEWALDPQGRRGAMHNVPEESFWCCVLQHGLLALEALHAARIVHGNPLPFNMFIYVPGHYKLGSFGSSVKSPSAYPTGTPSALLPPNEDGMSLLTPYEVDVFVFASGMLQLLGHCIAKRRDCAMASDPHSLNMECPRADLFTTRDNDISFASYRESRAKGYHNLSDHLWGIFQAALCGKTLRVLLKMLDTPTRSLWAARALLETEKRRLLQRKNMLQKALLTHSHGKSREKGAPEDAQHDRDDSSASTLRGSLGSAASLWSSVRQKCTAEAGPQQKQQPFMSPVLLPRPSSAASRRLAPDTNHSGVLLGSQGATTSVCGKDDVDCGTSHRPSRTMSSINNMPPPLVWDLSVHSPLSTFCTAKNLNSLKQGPGGFRYFRDGEADFFSVEGTTCSGLCSRPRSRVGAAPQSDGKQHRMEENLYWNVRQIMAVMGWLNESKEGAVLQGKQLHAGELLSTPQCIVRPLTSWE